jgi:hypothetical protein
MMADTTRKIKALVFADQRLELATVPGGTDMPGGMGTPRGMSERSELRSLIVLVAWSTHLTRLCLGLSSQR